MNTHNPRSLVTGGAGFIGSHVAAHCLRLGHEVTVLDDLSGGFEDQVPAGARFIQGSVTDAALVDAVFREGRFDYVYHLAAYAAEGLSHFIRRFNYANNLGGSVTLINAAVKSGVRCFVFTSSIAVYGKNQLPMTEDLTPRPEDPYGISKYAVELDLQAAHEMFGLPFIVFRPHNVYGPHQNVGDPYRNVLGIFMNQIMRDEPFTVFGDGEQTRAFTHVDDVAPHIAQAVFCRDAYNQVFNIGSDTPYTVKAVAHMIADAFGMPLRLHRLPARNEVNHAYADHAKAARVLGIEPQVPLEVGVRHMAAWAREAGARTGKPFENIEVTTNLPPSWMRLGVRAAHA
jgi:UDP-glucose 4-epimerase